MEELPTVNLVNLAQGAAIEKFEREFQRVIENIADVNTDETAIREVVLRIKIKPTSRKAAVLVVDAVAKLAPEIAEGTTIYFGTRNGQKVAVEQDERQMRMFDGESEPTEQTEPAENVSDFKRGRNRSKSKEE